VNRHFVVYDPASGAIARWGFCSDPEDAARQARAGEAVIVTDRLCPGNAFRVDVTNTPASVVAIANAAAPSPAKD